MISKEIDILGVKFRVEEVECVSKEELRKGEINYLTCTIRIDKTMPRDLREQTLMHEILHGMLDLLGYEDLNADESKVQGMATALHQIFTTQSIFQQ